MSARTFFACEEAPEQCTSFHYLYSMPRIKAAAGGHRDEGWLPELAARLLAGAVGEGGSTHERPQAEAHAIAPFRVLVPLQAEQCELIRHAETAMRRCLAVRTANKAERCLILLLY